MIRLRPKRKDKSFKVKFNGRFKITKDQANAFVAFRILRHCNSIKNSAKTELVFTINGFYIGKSVSVLDIKKKVFYTDYIFDFFVFKETPQCTIILEKEHDNMWMSYFKFVDDVESDDFITYLENIKNISANDGEEMAENDHSMYTGVPRVGTMTLDERVNPIFRDSISDRGSLPSYRSRYTSNTGHSENIKPDIEDEDYASTVEVEDNPDFEAGNDGMEILETDYVSFNPAKSSDYEPFTVAHNSQLSENVEFKAQQSPPMETSYTENTYYELISFRTVTDSFCDPFTAEPVTELLSKDDGSIDENDHFNKKIDSLDNGAYMFCQHFPTVFENYYTICESD